MDTRRRMIAVITIVVGVIVFVLLCIGLLVNRSGVVSPLPEDTAIKIIFITPTPLRPADGGTTEGQAPTP